MKKLIAAAFALTSFAAAQAAVNMPAGDAVAGKAAAAVCAACHGADGKGNVAMGAPNLTDKIWLHGGSLAATVTFAPVNPAPDAVIEKPADFKRGKEHGDIEWTLLLASVDIFEGGLEA